MTGLADNSRRFVSSLALWEPGGKCCGASKPNGGESDFLDATNPAFVTAYMAGVESKFGTVILAKPKDSTQSARAPRYSMI